MKAVTRWSAFLAVLAACSALAAPAGATALRRVSLAELVQNNAWVVVGQVLDAKTRWNADHTMIFTDYRIEVVDAAKGRPKSRQITVTQIGGTEGQRTVAMIGGAALAPGSTYLLFLSRTDLPGLKNALTVTDHCQGVFELSTSETGVIVAKSQARDFGLLPDLQGSRTAPGETSGFELATLLETVRELARGEVKR